jgi:hypothetical protein
MTKNAIESQVLPYKSHNPDEKNDMTTSLKYRCSNQFITESRHLNLDAVLTSSYHATQTKNFSVTRSIKRINLHGYTQKRQQDQT